MIEIESIALITPRSASRQGAILFSDAATARLVTALRARFKRVVFVSPLSPQQEELHDHCVNLPNADIVSLPHFRNFAEGMRASAKCLTAISSVEKQVQASLVQLPFPPALGLARPKVPRLYHVCADVLLHAPTSTAYTGVKRALAIGVAGGTHLWQRYLTSRKESDVVTNGKRLLSLYGARGRGTAVVSSSLWARELQSASRQRTGNRFRVLFVGYLRAEKGVDVLIPAFRQLLQEGVDAELCVVGPRSSSGDVSHELEKEVAKLTEDNRIDWLGHRPFGPELFQCYADADVLAVPSRSEGTPRVLVEARAFGCPVVGSSVGGIPTSIDDGRDGLLVPPGDAAALCSALLRISRDAELRNRLIAGGLQRAQRCTMERFAELLAAKIQSLSRK